MNNSTAQDLSLVGTPPHAYLFATFILIILIWFLYGAWRIREYKKRKKVRTRWQPGSAATSLRPAHTHSSINIRSMSKVRRRSSVTQTLFALHEDEAKEARIRKDASALLARASPSERVSGELKNDRLVGWFTLYVDIPPQFLNL